VSGTCPSATFSPYVPTYSTNSTSTSFQYPIYLQTVCQNSRMIIACPTDQVIHIFSAYFGIQSGTTTTTCTTSSQEIPAACYFLNAYNTIKATCESLSSCYLRATVNSMAGADLCPSYQKQLTVQYQCVDTAVLANITKTVDACFPNTTAPLICPATTSYGLSGVSAQTWCDGSSMSIQCASGKNIQILCAFYGLHPSLSACNVGFLSYQPVCYFKSSMATVNSTCNGLNSCVVGNFSSTFLDPCIDVDKALYVQWRCV
jgi:hypothetical protein